MTKEKATAAENKKTEVKVSEQIWKDLKDREMSMFSLPSQKVSDYVVPVEVEPSKLYVTLKVSSVLPVLEELVSSKYSVEVFDKYIAISNKVQ